MNWSSAPRDALLIYSAAFIRSTAVSYVGVTLAIHLAQVGLSAVQIGLLIGVGMAGASVATLIMSFRADAWGRRRMLVGLAALSAVGYFAVGAFTDLAVLLPLALVGMLNGVGRDRGAASALDQAILPETVSDRNRTWLLAWYNVVLDVGHACGALLVAVPALLTSATGRGTAASYQLTFLVCAAAMCLCVVPYVGLTPRIEIARVAGSTAMRPPLEARSKRIITRLAMLFGLDSLGGGFLNSALIAYWFFREYGMSEAELAVLFFAARVLNALSHVFAAWLARRIGLLNTMVWTHLPSSVFLMMAPASPNATIAAALFLAREALVEMDVPTRQSYVMAVVQPSERAFASGITNVTKNGAWALGPTLAGIVMQHVAFAGPLVIGGMLKISYDLLLYRAFRHVRPPEEE